MVVVHGDPHEEVATRGRAMDELDVQDVRRRVLAGEALFVLNRRTVVKADEAWLRSHPGGAKAILHMVGRDATDEVNAYHGKEARQLMRSCAVGRVKGWTNMRPPIQAASAPIATQDDDLNHELITRKYRELEVRVSKAGYFRCGFSGYAREIARYGALGMLSFVFLRNQCFLTSAIFLGLLWHQLVFTVHDAGHTGITHNYTIDTLISIFIADLIGGLSMGWWKDNHNVHHLVTNHPEHDPDIQHMPFFATSKLLLESLRSTYYNRVMTFDAVAQCMIRIQAYTYYPILCFGRFNLYVLSWTHLLTNRATGRPAFFRRLEIACMVVFWYWFGYLVVYRSIPDVGSRIGFVLVSHVVTMPLHVQITLSHFAMSTSDLGAEESFAAKMLRTTMDVSCPAWLDFIHGGLQFQAVHHLFPRMPRHNLRSVQPLVRDFCKEVGLEYSIYGFVDGSQKVFSRLDEIAQQARIMQACAKSMIA